MPSTRNKRIKAHIKAYCTPYGSIYINNRGELIEKLRTGYCRIEGLTLEFTGVDFMGEVIKG